MHANLRIGATTFMASDGGQIQMPLAKTFWSPLFGMVADRFGVSWMINVIACANSGPPVVAKIVERKIAFGKFLSAIRDPYGCPVYCSLRAVNFISAELD